MRSAEGVRLGIVIVIQTPSITERDLRFRYDIREDKTRRHVARTLEAFGRRVQRSVFECEVTRPQYDALKGQLEAALETPEESDSIRCYQLCGACVRKANVIGTGSFAEDPSYYLV